MFSVNGETGSHVWSYVGGHVGGHVGSHVNKVAEFSKGVQSTYLQELDSRERERGVTCEEN